MTGTIVAAALALGAVIGSFLNVVIHRLPRGESVVFPRSHCPRCGVPIAPRDNVPIVSYLALRGRCRHCGAVIPPRYVIVEGAAALLFAALAWRIGPTPAAVRDAVFGCALLVVFFTDLERGLIPNAVTYPGIVAGVAFAAWSGSVLSSLAAAAASGGLFLVIAIVSRGGMGGGDIKLAAMIGAFLGAAGAAVAIFVGVALGAAAGAVLMALRLRTRKQTMPFGPALAAGAMIAMFASGAIVRWYLATMIR
jgi:leader peptidase (prepilin peptidase)/N-methyltransferase